MKNCKESLLLYAVTDRAWTQEMTLEKQVEEAILGGVSCVQLREKNLPEDEFLDEALRLRALCRRYEIPLIINDNVKIAIACHADGVHVGQEDWDPVQVRKAVGPDMWIGVTAKTVEQALAAQKAGADYLGSGAVFGTTTKVTASMTRQTLTQICASVTIPVVAIGGISKANVEKLEGTGIAGAAIVSGIFAEPDIREACKDLRSKLERII